MVRLLHRTHLRPSSISCLAGAHARELRFARAHRLARLVPWLLRSPRTCVSSPGRAAGFPPFFASARRLALGCCEGRRPTG